MEQSIKKAEGYMSLDQIAILISFLSFCFAVWIGSKGDKRTDTKDIEERAKENARINFKLDEISGTTREIKQDISSMRDDIKHHNEKIVELESSVKQAHKRLDAMERKLEQSHDEA